MKPLVGSFNEEKAIVGPSLVNVKLGECSLPALVITDNDDLPAVSQ